MKKNAILIAAVAFATGCAHHQGGYVRSDYDAGYTYEENEMVSSQAPMMTTENPQRDPQQRVIVQDAPPVAVQYDPALDQGVGTAGSFQSGTETGWEGEFEADSSARGTSLRARGVELSDSELEGPVTDVINPLVEADSSRRGTSLRARGFNPGQEQEVTLQSSPDTELKADSSQRGGSLQARTEGRPFGEIESEINVAEDISWQQDQEMQATATYQPEPREAELNLNTGEQIEENMTGEYELDAQIETEGLGRPAQSEMNQGQSENWEDNRRRDLEDISEDARLLYDSNPAHGVGSATAPNTAANAAAMVETEVSGQAGLAQRVKRQLTTESTGTHGMMSPMVARNVEVTAQNGVVTLRGVVPTERDKEVLAIRAREIPGVREVKNEIKVSPEGQIDQERTPTATHNLDEIQDTIQE